MSAFTATRCFRSLSKCGLITYARSVLSAPAVSDFGTKSDCLSPVKLNTSNVQEHAPGAGSKSKSRKGRRQLIRLGDLIPGKDFKRGSESLFGVTDTIEQKQHKTTTIESVKGGCSPRTIVKTFQATNQPLSMRRLFLRTNHP